MRKLQVAAVILTLSCTGCVVWIHDGRIASLHSRAASLDDFAGTFCAKAEYYTPPNLMGLEGDDRFPDIIFMCGYGGRHTMSVETTSQFTVSIVTNNNIEIRWGMDGLASAPTVFRAGSDFTFRDSRIVFAQKFLGGSNDSPAIGLCWTRMEWRLDPKGNLVVIRNGGGGGLMTVIPMGVYGKTMSTFSRIEVPGTDTGDP
jgi:hypothetical protein